MSGAAADARPATRQHRSLEWGRRYAMVRPDQFRVDYRINPFMDLAVQPDGDVAMSQWLELRDVISRLGGSVDVLDQRPDSPDMVFAMNLGLALTRHGGTRVAMSHMRFPQRRGETESAAHWFADAGFAPSYLGRGGVGAHFEAGDAFPFAGSLLMGYGPRSEELAVKAVAAEYSVRALGFRIVHPSMYHFDLAFCPLDERTAMVCPAALDDASAAALLRLIPEPITVTEEEALSTLCANSIVIGRTVVMPGCPDRVRVLLERAGFSVVVVDVSEFHKAGGAVRCLTNPLDIVIGRDLDDVPGGEVALPAA